MRVRDLPREKQLGLVEAAALEEIDARLATLDRWGMLVSRGGFPRCPTLDSVSTVVFFQAKRRRAFRLTNPEIREIAERIHTALLLEHA